MTDIFGDFGVRKCRNLANLVEFRVQKISVCISVPLGVSTTEQIIDTHFVLVPE